MGMDEDCGPLGHSISSDSLCTSRSYPDEGLNSPFAEVDLCDDEILKLWADMFEGFVCRVWIVLAI